jgi:hypothetical protein
MALWVRFDLPRSAELWPEDAVAPKQLPKALGARPMDIELIAYDFIVGDVWLSYRGLIGTLHSWK